jgi:hypothetical protein
MSTPAIDLAPGTHLCAMYRGAAQRDELLGPYVAAGLRSGHTCFVAVCDPSPDRIRSFAGPDSSGELIVRTRGEPVFAQDDFDIDEILAFWETTVSAAIVDDGAPFVRLSAEATWWLTQLPAVEDLLDYEARLNAFAARHPQSILCLYDIDELGPAVVFEAMKVHPRIWLSGLVLDNPFFVPTD